MMKQKTLILSISLLLFFSAQVIMANVFAHNVRITQPDSDAPFDGNFDDGSGAAIRFVLSDIADSLEIRIMTDSGAVVRTLSATDFNRGDTSLVWDGLDDGGLPVASGAYKVAISTSQAGYADYEVLFDAEIGIWTRGVASMKSQAVRNFGFQFAASGGGYVTGMARHSNDGNEWGDVKGAASLSVESVDPIGEDNFRYSATADSEGNIFVARRSGTVPAVYMMNADEQVMRRIDSSDWGGQRPQGLAVTGGASEGFLVISNHIGDIYGMELDGSPDYFDSEADLLVSGNPTNDLFFSEYVEGSGNNKALEIYNGTNGTIDLADYLIAQSVNGGGWQYYHVFPDSAVIGAGDVYVILNSQMDTLIYKPEDADEVLDYPSVVHHNGDDARGLAKVIGLDTLLIDVIGVPTEDPGTGWDVAGVPTATANHTLVRKASVLNGNTDWAASAGTNTDDSEWIVLDQDSVQLGSHSMDNLTAVFWDITIGRDQFLYATYNNGDLNFKGGVACFDFTANDGTPYTLEDALWKVEVDSSLAHTLTYYFADDPANDIVYYTLNDPPKWDGIGIYAIDIANPTMSTQIYADPDQNMSSYRSDIAMDAVGNIVFFENSNEFVRLISPPGGNSYEYVDEFDFINVSGSESIADIKVDADSDFVPDRIGEAVKIQGIVTTNNYSSSSILIGFQDETAGIVLYQSGNDTTQYEIGTLLLVQGEVTQYRGLTELNISDVTVLGSADVPAPIVVTPDEFNMKGEELEGMLVKINAVSKTADATWPNPGGSGGLDISDGYGVARLWLDIDTGIPDTTEVVYPINVTGLAAQYSNSSPPNDGYQLWPRFYDDFEQDVVAPPSPYFFFTDETHTMYNGQTIVVSSVDDEFTFAWHPAIDLNGDDLIYQVQAIIDGSNLDINVGGDTSVVLTGQDIIDNVYSAESKTVQFTLRTKGSEPALVTSVDTISVTFDITVGVEDMNIIPKEFYVDQNYPNPFNPTTAIKFGLPAQANVNLVIYDILGRIVTTLIDNKNMSAGVHQLHFDASNLASGTYIYRLQADKKVEVRKMLLLK